METTILREPDLAVKFPGHGGDGRAGISVASRSWVKNGREPCKRTNHARSKALAIRR
jgi:hypothetical protein